MFTGYKTEENLPPQIVFKMPYRVKGVKALPDFKIEVLFVDERIGIYDCKPHIFKENPGVFKPLQKENEFNKVTVDFGAVTWPCGVDIAPDAMYDRCFNFNQ